MTELDFVATDWYKITGRGWAAAIESGETQLPKGMMPSELLGKHVRIDGKEYYVAGVERAGYTRKFFGLLIRGDR